MEDAEGAFDEPGKIRCAREFRFTIEHDGPRARAIFEFTPLPDDRRLGKVIDYLFKASKPVAEDGQ